MRYLNEVKLAGLLHDIGKFYQKAGTGKTVAGVKVQGHHALVSANFVEYYRTTFEKLGLNVDAVKEMVQHHHTRSYGNNVGITVNEAKVDFKSICNVINIADNISSSERLEDTNIKTGGNYAVVPLASIFSTWSPDNKKYNYPVGKFATTHNKASSSYTENSTAINTSHIEEFARELEDIEVNADTDFNTYFDALNELLRKYLWCIPSDSQQRLPDVSLYDHLKTTSALAAVIYDELVTNPLYKKGLRSDKEALGWEFTNEAVAKVDSFAILKVGIKNPERFIMKNHTGEVSNLEYIEVNKKFLSNSISTLERTILNTGTPLSTANVVIKQTYTRYILVNSNNVPAIVENFNKYNTSFSIETGMEVYFEMSVVNIPQHDMGTQNVHKYIRELDKVFESSGEYKEELGTKYYGIDGIITSENAWLDSKGIFTTSTTREMPKLSENVQGTIGEFIKNTENKALCIVRISIDNLDESMEDLFKISSKTLDTFTKEYTRKRMIAETTGTFEDNDKDEEADTFEYATISRVATATRMISDGMSLRYNNTILVTTSPNTVEFIAPANDILTHVNNFRTRMNKMTFGKLTFTAHIISFKASDELEYVYRRLTNSCENKSDVTNIILYNGKSLKWDEIGEAKALMESVNKSLELNMSNIYKIREFISGYYEYVATGNVTPVLGIARYFNNKEKNFNDKTIDSVVCNFVTEQFNAINSGKKPSHMLEVLLELMNDSLSIKIRRDK